MWQEMSWDGKDLKRKKKSYVSNNSPSSVTHLGGPNRRYMLLLVVSKWTYLLGQHAQNCPAI